MDRDGNTRNLYPDSGCEWFAPRTATHCRPRPGCESASHCCAAAKNVQQWAQLNDEDWCWPGHQLPFGQLWYGEPDAVANAISYAKFFSRSHDAVIRVYDEAGEVIYARTSWRFQRVV